MKPMGKGSKARRHKETARKLGHVENGIINTPYNNERYIS